MGRSLNDRKGGGGRNYDTTPVLEEDIYPARLVQYIDLGSQPQFAWKGKEKPDAVQVWLTYELVDAFMLGDEGKEDEDKPRWISEQFVLYRLSAENAKSSKRYNALDPTGKTDGHLEHCVDFPCQVDVMHGKLNQDGRPYENVRAVTKVGRRSEVPELVNEPVVFDWFEPDIEVFEGLPDFLKEKIMNASNYNDSPIAALIGPKAKSQAAKAEVAEEEEEEEEDEWSDAPF